MEPCSVCTMTQKGRRLKTSPLLVLRLFLCVSLPSPLPYCAKIRTKGGAGLEGNTRRDKSSPSPHICNKIHNAWSDNIYSHRLIDLMKPFCQMLKMLKFYGSYIRFFIFLLLMENQHFQHFRDRFQKAGIHSWPVVCRYVSIYTPGTGPLSRSSCHDSSYIKAANSFHPRTGSGPLDVERCDPPPLPWWSFFPFGRRNRKDASTGTACWPSSISHHSLLLRRWLGRKRVPFHGAHSTSWLSGLGSLDDCMASLACLANTTPFYRSTYDQFQNWN